MILTKYLVIVFFILLQTLKLAGQTDTAELSLVFTGDIMGHDSQIKAAWYDSLLAYDYAYCFQYIKPFVEKADIAIGNLEVTLGGPPYKGYPQFSSPDALATALKESGFDILVNANNHALDRGTKGLGRTLHVLDSLQFIQSGVFNDSLQRELYYPLVVEKNGIRLALLNYTYGTNGLRVKPPNMVNYIRKEQIRQDCDQAKQAEPDYIIALMHWGTEYQRIQNSKQEDLTGFLFQNGVDAIVGSHPHVVQPVWIDSLAGSNALHQPVAYSLGNLISNQRERYRNGGIILRMHLTKTDRTQLTDISYVPVFVHKPKKMGSTRFTLLPANPEFVARTFPKLTEADSLNISEFYKDTRSHLNIREDEYFRHDLP